MEVRFLVQETYFGIENTNEPITDGLRGRSRQSFYVLKTYQCQKQDEEENNDNSNSPFVTQVFFAYKYRCDPQLEKSVALTDQPEEPYKVESPTLSEALLTHSSLLMRILSGQRLFSSDRVWRVPR